MGNTLTTPLSLTLDHWQDVQKRANNLSVTVKKKKWKTLCASEWPTFNTSWPPEGTFNIDSILQVKSRIFIQGPQGHPDQIPYIITWEDLASTPPSWVAPFSPPKSPSSSSPLEPSAPLLPVPPLLPPQTSQLYPVLDKSETSTKPGATPKKVLPPEDSALIDLLADEPPPYQPQPLPALGSNPPSSEEEEDDQEGPTASAPPDPSPMVGQLRGRRDHTAPGDTSRVLPLRQMGGPNGQYQYWPFSASDLYNWKTHNPSFAKDPVALTSLIESILVTHQPRRNKKFSWKLAKMYQGMMGDLPNSQI
ncbi:uncharacterized protein LOC144370904 [Ictidomys tridecemlineatus]